MPRIPEPELQRLKDEVSVQRLVEAAGVELKKAGKDWLGRCPFHQPDTDPSLVVTPAKNLWHCFGCQIGGGPIDWVMKSRGVSFRHAVELLKAEVGAGVGASSSAAGGSAAAAGAEGATPAKRSTVRLLPAPVALDADDRTLLNQAIDYYHQRFKESPVALDYLRSRGLDHPQLVDTFKLGVADRTLGLRLPNRQRQDGAAVRAQLQRIGLIRDSGHEHFNGSLVVPVFDAGGPQTGPHGGGQVVEVYGRKLLDNLRSGTPKHLYLPRPADAQGQALGRGVFNLAGVQAAGRREPGQPGAREVILCEALIDAMSFWCAGFTNVTSAYGVEGFTAEMLEALLASGIERVFIAYDRDAAGDLAADKLAPQLIEAGLEVRRVVFPQGMDANEYACDAGRGHASVPQAQQAVRQALAVVLRQAQWVGGVPRIEAPAVRPEPVRVAEAPVPAAPPSVLAANPPADPSPITADAEAVPTELPEELRLDTGVCTWRIRGWKKNLSPEAMRVNVQVRRRAGGGDAPDDAAGNAPYFVDTLDLYAARSRGSFVRQAAVELGLGEEALKRELGGVFLRLEGLQDELMSQAREAQQASRAPKVPVLSAEQEAQALDLLRAPEL